MINRDLHVLEWIKWVVYEDEDAEEDIIEDNEIKIGDIVKFKPKLSSGYKEIHEGIIVSINVKLIKKMEYEI